MKKILLASLYKVFLKRNKNLLTRNDLEIFTATRGTEALRLHEEHQFDLILSDLQLEDMGGCTLCSLVRKSEKSPQVPIVLTCHNLPGSKERVEQSGASAMLLKPIDPIQLMETIGRFIDLPLMRSKRAVLKVKVLSRKPDLEFFCVSHDISTTGILLETEHLLALGTRITCQFNLPGSGQIELHGEVIRTINAAEFNHLYGIKFINIPLTHHRAINLYISATAMNRITVKDLPHHAPREYV